jgi:hypothetical protein
MSVQIAKAVAPAVVTRRDTTHHEIEALVRRVSHADRAGRTPAIPATIAAAA